MKTISNYRDLFLLTGLLFMVKAAWNLPSKRSLTQPILTESIANNKTVKEPVNEKSFSVHEADQNVISQMKDLQKQIDHAIELVQPSTTQAARLQSMNQRLAQFRREYKYTSPAVALLGPIGYTGVVIKEQRIEKGVLKIINALNTILHEHAELQEEYVPVKAIAQGIEIAHTTLAQLDNPETSDQEKETVN